MRLRKRRGAACYEPGSGEKISGNCFSEDVPRYARVFAILILTAFLSLSAYIFIAEAVAICRRGSCGSLYGNDAKWYALFLVALGLGLSAFAFRIRIAKAALLLSGLLLIASIVGFWLAKN